jgi:hypothetical protein
MSEKSARTHDVYRQGRYGGARPLPTRGVADTASGHAQIRWAADGVTGFHEREVVAPRAIVATLLDEGQYVASVSTFYRILRAHNLTHERRAIATHPARVKPELVTTAPNELWSWGTAPVGSMAPAAALVDALKLSSR